MSNWKLQALAELRNLELREAERKRETERTAIRQLSDNAHFVLATLLGDEYITGRETVRVYRYNGACYEYECVIDGETFLYDGANVYLLWECETCQGTVRSNPLGSLLNVGKALQRTYTLHDCQDMVCRIDREVVA